MFNHSLFKTISFFFLILLCTSTVLGADISVTGLTAIGYISPPDSYTGDRDNIFYVAKGTDLTTYDVLGVEESTGSISGFPASITSVYGKQDYVYVALLDGRCYKIENSIGTRTFASLQFGTDNPDGYYLGDYSAGTTRPNFITVDRNDNIYISSQTNNKIYRIDGDSLTSIEWLSVNGPLHTSLGPDGIIFAIDGTSFRTSPSINVNNLLIPTSPTNYLSQGIARVANGNYVTVQHSSSTHTVREVSSTGGLLATLGTFTSSHGGTASNNIIILPSGVIVYSNDMADIVRTYSTIDNVGGYESGFLSTGTTENEYSKTEVVSNYATYFNNSKFYITTNVITKSLDASILNTSLTNTQLAEEFKEQYALQVDILNPDNAPIKTYYYDGNDFVTGKVKTPLVIQFPWLTIDTQYLYLYDTKEISNSNPWVNGTYTLVLYEVNKISGNKAVIDTSSFEVLDEGFSGNIIDNPDINSPDNTNLEQKVTSFLNSKIFFALIIILGVASIAKNREGGYSLGGLMLMIPIGIIASVIMGFIPVWVLFLMVFVVVAVIVVHRGD